MNTCIVCDGVKDTWNSGMILAAPRCRCEKGDEDDNPRGEEDQRD